MFLFQRPNRQDSDSGRRGQDSLHETASQQGGSSIQCLASRIRIWIRIRALAIYQILGKISAFFFLKQTCFACQYLIGKHSSSQI